MHQPRRDFLKAAAAGTGMLAYAVDVRSASRLKAADVKISEAKYTPVSDYPIQPKTYSDVTIDDTFWRPKIKTNAEVTIPFGVRKLSGSGRGFGGGVLEAAMLSLKTHPDATLQEQVDLSVSFPKYRMDPGKLETLKMMLVACSDDLSRQLGNQKATPTEDVA